MNLKELKLFIYPMVILRWGAPVMARIIVSSAKSLLDLNWYHGDKKTVFTWIIESTSIAEKNG